MTTASELVPRMAAITGLPHAEVYAVKRQFVESGSIALHRADTSFLS